MVSAGELDQRVAIDAQVTARGPSNEKLVSWAPFVTETWANIKPMSVTGLMAAQAVQSNATVMIKIRFREGINQTMRVRRIRDGAIYAMQAAPLPGGRRGMEWLTLTCSQGMNDGQ
jgi:SPP1 family predicted phage head-tail adaptor